MARPIASPQNVHYNGFDFPAPLSLKVRCQPNYDRAEATVKHRSYAVSVEVILVAEDFVQGEYTVLSLSPGDAIDTAMTILRKRLTEPGKTLKLKNQGLGADLTIDYSNAVARGPKPRVLVFEPIGSNLSCRIVWECEFTVIECASGIITSPYPLGEFVYSVDFGINQEGMTTVTLAGRIEVNVKRQGEVANAYRMIDKTADDNREMINFGQPSNAQRTRSYRLSEDKRFLDFVITDTEIPSDNPFFPGCVRMDMRQRTGNVGSYGPHGKRFTTTLSGTIEVAPGYPRALAWAAFVWVVKKRLKAPVVASGGGGRGVRSRSYSEGGGNPGSYPETPVNKGKLLLRAFDMEEEIFGRSMRFSLTFEFSINKPHELLTACGFWEPIGASSDWNRWKASMMFPTNRAPHSPRGAAQRGVIAGRERVVDFCLGLSSAVPSYSRAPVRPLLTYAQKIFSPPDKNDAWLQYDVRVHIQTQDGGTVVSRRVGATAGSRGSTIEYMPGGSSGKVENTGASPSDDSVEIQQRADPVYHLVLVGVARRVASPIEIGDLAFMDTIDGQPAEQYLLDMDLGTNEVVETRGDLYTVFKRKWSMTFVMPSPKVNFKVKNIP